MIKIQYAGLMAKKQFLICNNNSLAMPPLLVVKGNEVSKIMTNLTKLALASACALTLSGCAVWDKFRSPAQSAVSMAGVVPADYLIGPGDAVNIIVWRNPEVSMSVPVRPDGKITTPLVEDLPAAGKTSTELARDIEKALAKFIQQPVVTVVVTGFVGNYGEQIRVIGQAAKPQALPYRRDMSLMDVLIAVGGVTEFASGNRASIIRTVDGKQQKLNVRLDDLIKDGDISANMPMRPGDILVIPESFF
ncbi:MAG: Sugar transporter substrate-binding protein [Massilia sp.]|nr:Sugar transporter substrate-binding protein [Massilia sp.]